jgi:hypothetical protein
MKIQSSDKWCWLTIYQSTWHNIPEDLMWFVDSFMDTTEWILPKLTFNTSPLYTQTTIQRHCQYLLLPTCEMWTNTGLVKEVFQNLGKYKMMPSMWKFISSGSTSMVDTTLELHYIASRHHEAYKQCIGFWVILCMNISKNMYLFHSLINLFNHFNSITIFNSHNLYRVFVSHI